MTVTINGTTGITTPGVANTGNETVTGTLTTNGITAATGGITFNANPGGGTQATLNDYEVGTYTPTVTNNNGSITYTASGYYTKVGRMVTANITVSISAVSASGNAIVTLPFTSTAANLSVCGRESGVLGASLNSQSGGTAVVMFTYNNNPTAVAGYILLIMASYVSTI